MTAQPAAGRPRTPAPAPVEHEPIDAVALFKEVVLERLQNTLERLLMRLKRYRARRGNRWEQDASDEWQAPQVRTPGTH